MAKKKLQSGFEFNGIAPNTLLSQVESTAPFLFSGEIDTSGPRREFLAKLKFYKKNKKAMQQLNLSEYFYMCLAAHWSTAGTFVPTDVDNQIREGLWKHKHVAKHLEKMARMTIDSWKWDYEQVTNRKSYNRIDDGVMSTHEGTWLSVAIGAYCALTKNKMNELAQEVADVILAEIKKEEQLMLQLREDRDHINFLRAAPLIAHNLGDLDRVMLQWNMHETNVFCKSIYKLGHIPSKNYSPILVYTGKVNKEFSSKENHRHMAMRRPKSIRSSHKFLIPVGPFMDQWGHNIGSSELITIDEKADIATALYEGFLREKEAFGYARAFGAILNSLENGLTHFEASMPFDLIRDIKQSEFYTNSQISLESFEKSYIERLNQFECPITGLRF